MAFMWACSILTCRLVTGLRKQPTEASNNTNLIIIFSALISDEPRSAKHSILSRAKVNARRVAVLQAIQNR